MGGGGGRVKALETITENDLRSFTIALTPTPYQTVHLTPASYHKVSLTIPYCTPASYTVPSSNLLTYPVLAKLAQ